MSQDKENINDCWNKIGVWRRGDDICSRLEYVIHCRNCDTYIENGLNLLDRAIPDGYIQSNTRLYRESKNDEDTTTVSCIIFRIDDEWFAFNTFVLDKINENENVHSIPHNKNSLLLGLVNIMGELEICLSLKPLVFTGVREPSADNGTGRMMVISLESGKYVIKVDEIMGIFRISSNEMGQAPVSLTMSANNLISSVFEHNKFHIGLINEKNLQNCISERTS
ncbi:MAG TPA: hypothetical protein ENI65_08355 [Gammaproteobacteria bacterium]|nr:hypothetical protein [Gammaproteobacteria bacterium]